jgi:hypothetical protein
MRTVKKSFIKRLEVQAKEAKTQGLSKVAHNVKRAVDGQVTRENDASYTYADDEFRGDIEYCFWKAAIRAVDFYNSDIDASDLQKVIEVVSEDFIKEMRVLGNVKHGVGAYEPNIPGETSKRVAIEVEEE